MNQKDIDLLRAMGISERNFDEAYGLRAYFDCHANGDLYVRIRRGDQGDFGGAVVAEGGPVRTLPEAEALAKRLIDDYHARRAQKIMNSPPIAETVAAMVRKMADAPDWEKRAKDALEDIAMLRDENLHLSQQIAHHRCSRHIGVAAAMAGAVSGALAMSVMWFVVWQVTR